MLVLSRKVGQELVIGDNVRIIIQRVSGNRVAVGIEAPNDVHIVRGELKDFRDEFQSEPAPAIKQYGAPLSSDSCDSGSYAPRCAR